MTACPECGGTARLVETRLTAGGANRRRRFRCTACPHRWSVVSANAPTQPPLEMIADIRLSHEPETVLAARHGCSTSMVGAIRRGEKWGNVATPRQTCPSCLHWHHERCSLGFPDPGEEGVGFARQCVTFQAVAS